MYPGGFHRKAIDLSNALAPEHLELAIRNPMERLDQVKHAGAIFLGHYSPEPVGDYMAGPNHVLPTSGTARFFSPLSVDDFVKKSSIIFYRKEALRKTYKDVARFARMEGLKAHANAMEVRFDSDDKREYLREDLRNLKAYQAGQQSCTLKLDANENPYPIPWRSGRS